MRRPSLYAVTAELERLEVPTLIVTGDEDGLALASMEANLCRLRMTEGFGVRFVQHIHHALDPPVVGIDVIARRAHRQMSHRR